ncbi:NAD(P)/FAD-dependent oxidoreductase [Bradyrhizobium japonicum]|uniref:NAD(P)/FAD-dependent oxidoreductase n=1 Tax=Bradyrhizobium japonicum TaxID=375 RepID=UPI0028A1E5DE|nr:FAD-dependent oxidoreductase [Bradyrhizobium japonicum]
MEAVMTPEILLGRSQIFIERHHQVDQKDLRSPKTPWAAAPMIQIEPVLDSFKCETLIIGAGITGALLAERFTRHGGSVVIIDREQPSQGSTHASTAMVLWEIDRPLLELTEHYGFERAARCYRASLGAVRGLIALVASHQLQCQMRQRLSLYLATDEAITPLHDEFLLRRRAELPASFLDYSDLLKRFAFTRAGALLSPIAADADPVQLAEGLLALSLQRGARLFHANATSFDSARGAVGVGLDNGAVIEAHHAILATGYVAPDIIKSRIQQSSSSWAIATKPQPENLWSDGALIWEACKAYHYARTTADGRIIFGGEDDATLIDPAARDAAIPEKTSQLHHHLKALWPKANGDVEFSWAGTFDTTVDGLPLIGAVPGHRNIYAAYGYGGNGITFSYLAAHLIAEFIEGSTSPLFDDFALDRDAL